MKQNNRKVLKYFFRALFFLISIFIIGFLIPTSPVSPILKKSIANIDPESFWYYPWGEAGVHKGIDIFCNRGTPVLSPVSGIVISTGYGSISGNYVTILGVKWRTYYFAHMDTVLVNKYSFITKNKLIGTVGNTGNAIGKPSHLHYSIKTHMPYFWQYRSKEYEAWQRIFYLNPTKYLGF
jgi:peptidoglycan LD-endopeptidase LytH